MKRSALAVVLVAAAGSLALTAPATHAATSTPAFTTQLLPGTSGSSEPRDIVDGKGTSFVSTNASNGDEAVFRSPDGLHWTQVTKPVGQTLATTDVDIVATPSGRIITSELDSAGINFITDYSDDQGKTWTQSALTTFADTDRQWYATGPNNRVYELFHNLLSGTLQHNMFVSTSTDGGATFGPPIPVATPPQQDYLDLQCADSGGPSNIFVNQKTGKVYVVFGTRSSPIGGCAASPVEVNIVAANRVWVVSADASATQTPGSWTPSLAVNDTATGQVTGMQLAPGAIDDAGNLYVAYPESIKAYPDYDGAAIKLVHSTNDGASWSAPTTIAPAGGIGNILPLVVAGDRGKVGLAWYHGSGNHIWKSMAGQVLDALSPTPHVTTVQLSDVTVENDTATKLMGACLQGTSATLNGFACGRSTDVNGLTQDSCGRMLAVWPAQAGLKSDGTYVSQQVSGARLRSAVCAASATKPVVVPVTKPGTTPVTKPVAKPGGHLAATGASALLAESALALLGLGLFLRRRAT